MRCRTSDKRQGGTLDSISDAEVLKNSLWKMVEQLGVILFPIHRSSQDNVAYEPNVSASDCSISGEIGIQYVGV